MRSYIGQEILLTYIKFMKSTFTKYKLLIKPLRKLSGFFLKREGLRMNRIVTVLLAIIIMGYSIYSWNDTSELSMLILQTLLGFMLVSLGVQNLKNNGKENRSIGIALLLVALFLIVVSLIKYFI
ncbi:DUF3953 domain-containing protein [Bacillus cereus]|uniref:DUF3953 domain-containing protein n=6 Tax=Bacillus cereus group TaxID=86661 RepID=A0A9X7G5L2_BACCE|nr:Hypothetical protein NF53_2639 [Bacillus thuringiensis serovar indiana]OMH31095.1 hypothetical protein BUM91_14285 [Bacillus thuringiensis]PED42776.1 DUF3953 domain-containing protein [Bacillus cereus]PKS16915.1 DUF3953 domain-containing protein [Bacillus sp. BI3]PEF17554.1 DUF3953 domain-containing protein [Bacillus cereus]